MGNLYYWCHDGDSWLLILYESDYLSIDVIMVYPALVVMMGIYCYFVIMES